MKSCMKAFERLCGEESTIMYEVNEGDVQFCCDVEDQVTTHERPLRGSGEKVYFHLTNILDMLDATHAQNS